MLKGLPEMLAKFRNLGQAVGTDVLQEDLLDAAQLIVEDAARRAPVLTGRLRSNIAAAIVKGSGATVKVGPTRRAPHGHLIEYGTSKMAARPFLRPAFDANKDRVLERLGKKVGARIEKAAK